MRTSTAPSARVLHRVLRALALPLPLALGGCRADGITTPDAAGAACRAACGPDGLAPAPSSAIVVAPLDDAVARIAPHMADTRTRAEVTPALGDLRRELLAGRTPAARLALARAYDAVDAAAARHRDADGGAVVGDLADLSAIRLALVPAAGALGVAVP